MFEKVYKRVFCLTTQSEITFLTLQFFLRIANRVMIASCCWYNMTTTVAYLLSGAIAMLQGRVAIIDD
jgi:hypothetical protein